MLPARARGLLGRGLGFGLVHGGGSTGHRHEAPGRVVRRPAACYTIRVIARAAPVLAYVLKDGLYLNVTSACTLACRFCPKIRDRNYEVGGYDLRLRRDPDADEVWEAALAAGLAGRAEVVFTGFGEASRRLDLVLDVTRRLRAAGVQRVRLDTDGLASLREGREVPPELAAAGMKAVSVSLNAPDAATYEDLCPSRYGASAYEAVRAFIRSALLCIPEVTASAVAVPGLSEAACRSAAESLGARFRWRPFDAIGRLAPARKR
jgi:TatD family-associated radical SAM protein